MNFKNQNQQIYFLAKNFLLNLPISEITPDLLDKYLHLSENRKRPDTISGIYFNLLGSAKNANMKSNVIDGLIGGLENLQYILCDFDPKKVLNKFKDDWEAVLDDIEKNINRKGKIRRAERSIWPNYCKTIISGADFLSKFKSDEDFYEWIDFFNKNDMARPALPMLLSNEIQGIGFALACDFLKELGYTNFGKPDVHIRDIFTNLEICVPRPTNYQLFKTIIIVAKDVGVTSYNVDKLFWLIGSGYFYDDIHIGKEGRIGSHKKEFIQYAKKELGIIK